MNREEYRKIIYELLYLVSCAVEDKTPEKQRIENLDMEKLYKAADDHMLTALAGYALEKCGIRDAAFVRSRGNSVRKTVIMEADKKLLFERFEEEKIWYMPLKGIVIKEFYPSLGLRQMADFDILFDSRYAEKVHDIMYGLGFTCKDFGKGVHDTYLKKPVSNFEMHKELFGDYHAKGLYDYYMNVFDRLVKDEENNYGYHFRNEDMYIYFLAHEYKHYSEDGTGLRSLVDTYVIWKALGDTFDKDYISEETEKIGIREFERKNRELAFHVLQNEKLSIEENELLDYMIYSGTYGNIENYVKHEVSRYGGGKKGKAKFVMQKIFLPMSKVKRFYPFFYRHKILIPCLLPYRVFKAMTVKKKNARGMLKALKKIK